jgi:hypothetical protein
MLHGVYESKVITEDGREQVVEVAPDWVMDNITAKARRSLHQVQKDWNEEHVDNTGRKEAGFLTLQGNDTILTEDGQKKVMLYELEDKRQISKVRFVPSKTIIYKGKEKILPERWRGLIRGLETNPDEFVWLESEWIEKNYPEPSLGLQKIQEMEE